MTKKKLSPSPLALEAQLPVSCPPLNRPPPWLPTMNITKHKTIQGHNINIISIQLGSPTGSGTAEKKNLKKNIHQFTVFYRCKKNKKSTRIHQMSKKGLKFWHVIWKSMWTNCYSFCRAYPPAGVATPHAHDLLPRSFGFRAGQVSARVSAAPACMSPLIFLARNSWISNELKRTTKIT